MKATPRDYGFQNATISRLPSHLGENNIAAPRSRHHWRINGVACNDMDTMSRVNHEKSPISTEQLFGTVCEALHRIDVVNMV